ncbi:hypothetical protein KN1_01670 [Stygiolobus caldivivus]|uniref:Uncharacterized protein n=1 Tax=Stygiolobus caldivivus TaxID=2824673 RepID=A0A8D5U4D3_9CREN|nr:hypothetical protein KN1_01670 [Stygiolobus caldivivus]
MQIEQTYNKAIEIHSDSEVVFSWVGCWIGCWFAGSR